MIERKSAIKKLIALGALVVLFVILTLLSYNKSVCEFFATTFARAWIYVFGHIASVLPFSCYELFLIVAIVLAVVFVVYLIIFMVKRKWNKLLSMTLIAAITVMSFLSIYTATASMTYNRKQLPQNIYKQYVSSDLSAEQAYEIAQIIVNGANEAYAQTEHDKDGNIVIPYSMQELSDKIDEAYKAIDGKYLSSYTPRGKKIINKTIMSEMHLVGVFFAPFGEANVNGYETNMYLPQTLAHEIAHSKGVMQEYQADIVSLYALLCSDDAYLRYSAYVTCLDASLQILPHYPNGSEMSSQLRAQINEGIYNERRNYWDFYAQFNHIDRVGEFLNDLYLKLQKQPDGVGNYVQGGEVVDTGEVTESGEPLFDYRFEGKQNLLITLFMQGKLK